MNRPVNLARGAVVAVAVVALAVTGVAPASANDRLSASPDRLSASHDSLSASPDSFSATSDRAADTGRVAVLEALVRDLDLSPADAEALFDSQPAAIELASELTDQLGANAGGAWYDHRTGTLTVAVTEAGDADLVSAAGAEVTVVERSEQELDAIKEELDALADADPAALAVAYSWGVDVRSNQVLLTVAEGQTSSFSSLVEQYGDAVRVEETDLVPALHHHPWLDGGIPYGIVGNPIYPWCSTGFNTRNMSTGVGFVLTAGHCISTGQVAYSHGITIGPAVASFFPTFDDALIRNDNPGQWSQGPWLWTHPGFITVRGWTDPAVGTAICKSGNTTGVTCGTVQVKNETVTFDDGTTVNWLTRTNACSEGGDSGGPNYTSAGTLGVGTTTGGQSIAGRCLEVFGLPNVSWYFPLTVSLPYYQSQFGVTLLTG